MSESAISNNIYTLEYAKDQDDIDILHAFKERFIFPQHNGHNAIYLCGNSLGLQPISTKYLFEQELKDWATYGVEGHFQARNPWFSYHQLFSKSLSKIVGASETEVVATNTLTVNLHLLLLSFYKPQGKRTKIIMEAGAFPSDMYAIETQVRFHGLNPDEHIIELQPREGEHTLRKEDIINKIIETGDELAVVLMCGVQYYTGQVMPMKDITAAAHNVGALSGFDLAHAVGNIPLSLHEWNVDFACWCSYKYLNSGPGGVGGLYVNQKWCDDENIIRLAGWWGNDESTRFQMKKGFIPAKSAASWQMSNAPVFNMVAHRASLDIYDKISVTDLRKKSIKLTGYLSTLLKDVTNLEFEVITPENEEERGAQLSLLFGAEGKKVFDILTKNGVIADWREPNVIRIAPAPLYNTFEDVFNFYKILKDINL